jgi:CDP-paratose 2-epimerase
MIDAIEGLLGRPVGRVHQTSRPGDPRYYVSDTRRLRDAVGWRPRTPWRQGLASLDQWIIRSKNGMSETAA